MGLKTPHPASLFSLAMGIVALAILFAPLPLAGPGEMVSAFQDERLRRALILSIVSSSFSATLALLLAILPAYYTVRAGGRVQAVVSNIHLLLLSIPPVGLGTAALVLLTRYPPASWVSEAFSLVFTPQGVVVAQVLVVTPIAISLLTGVFSMVPREMEESAVVYGAGWREVLTMVILPLSTPGLISAWGISFFRALGEFGATLILAGNIPGYTETLPLALYNAISLADVERASVIYTVILVVGLSAVVMHALVQRSMIKSPAILRV